MLEKQWILIEESSKTEYIMNKIYSDFDFTPNYYDRTNCPFDFSDFGNNVECYNLSETFKTLIPFDSDGNYKITPQIKIIKSIFAECMGNDDFMYAIDWQHSIFEYNPKVEEPYDYYMMYETLPDTRAYFPHFYPNGDYYLFVSKHFDWGYFTHPWQEKVWVFGKQLVELIKDNSQILGFVKCI